VLFDKRFVQLIVYIINYVAVAWLHHDCVDNKREQTEKEREQTGITINTVTVLQSLHHVHRKTIMGVATDDVGVVTSPPTRHARFMTFYMSK